MTEIDGLGGKERELGFQNSVILVGATNIPQWLDMAILRPGRFDHLVYIDLPDFEALEQIVNLHTSQFEIDKETKKFVIEKLSGFTGAEAVQVCKEAAL